jgi:hypothetical protein
MVLMDVLLFSSIVGANVDPTQINSTYHTKEYKLLMLLHTEIKKLGTLTHRLHHNDSRVAW